ncbi:hypothetical protein NPIL_279471 [Nephila pilipes]|uniref:Uncharacterized protein n=1 Tax=Nephila pilipes TaxID=299642 RepID=A0A8X6T8B6_NEPPI|nr:hypothetical protein NPIL_279471 [Nephila pilipes]
MDVFLENFSRETDQQSFDMGEDQENSQAANLTRTKALIGHSTSFGGLCHSSPDLKMIRKACLVLVYVNELPFTITYPHSSKELTQVQN